jgi:hypothetical protein
MKFRLGPLNDTRSGRELVIVYGIGVPAGTPVAVNVTVPGVVPESDNCEGDTLSTRPVADPTVKVIGIVSAAVDAPEGVIVNCAV